MPETATQQHRRKSERVSIDKEIARKAGIIAKHRDLSVSAVLDRKLAKPIEEEYRDVLREMQRDAKKSD